MRPNIQELSTEIKIVQAEIDLLTHIIKHHSMPVLLSDLDERNKRITILREQYFLLLD